VTCGTVALVAPTDGGLVLARPVDAPSLSGAAGRQEGRLLLAVQPHVEYPHRSRSTSRTPTSCSPGFSQEAVGEVIDFMVPETRESGRARDLLCAARAVRGRVTFELPATRALRLRPGRARGGIVTGIGAVFTYRWARRAPRRRAAESRGGPAARPGRGRRHVPWRKARRSTSTWSERPRSGPSPRRDRRAVHPDAGLLAQGWLSQSRYRGRWREMVHRSRWR